MNNKYSFIKLEDVVTDLTNERIMTVTPDMEIKDPTISSKTHTISTASLKNGSEVKIKNRVQIQPGDLVFSRLHTQNGAFAFSEDNYISTKTFVPFSINEKKIERKFLFWALHLQVPTLHASDTVGRETFKTQDILNLKIPLPSFPEQKKIANNLELINDLIEKSKSILKNFDNDKKILSNRIQGLFFNKSFFEKFQTSKLKDIAEIRSGVTLGRKITGNTIELPYLRVANVQDGFLNLDTIKKIKILETEITKWSLKIGDILLTEGGDWDKLGRGTVWNGEIPNCIHQNHIFRVRVDLKKINPYFLSYLIASPYGKSYFQNASKKTTNLASINKTQLSSFEVFIPPIKTQNEIVQKINNIQKQFVKLTELRIRSNIELSKLFPRFLYELFN